MKVWIIEKTLSDGSPVYDIQLGNERISLRQPEASRVPR